MGILILGIMAAIGVIVSFWGGTVVGDHVWPWESANAEDDDPFNLPDFVPDSVKKGLGAVLVIGGLILAVTLYKGRK